MNDQLNRIASLANDLAYGSKDPKTYINGAPHIKHASLRRLYGELVLQAFAEASKHTATPRVLDLGAGEGSVTLPFLELGARVTAVDISSRQIEALKNRCKCYGDRLETRCEDISTTLADRSQTYDIVAANSFLHHIPDYLSIIRQALPLLAPHGQFFSFQDPLHYDTVGMFTRIFTDVAYTSWRLSLGRKGDVIGGIRRRLRRRAASTCRIPCMTTPSITSPAAASIRSPSRTRWRRKGLSVKSLSTSARKVEYFSQ